jgi:Co/Zn/Cd efflux system component
MIFLFLLMMGLAVAWLAVPVARKLGYDYGRFGRTGDMAAVVVGALIGGILFIGVMALLGRQMAGDGGALVVGFLGAAIVVVLLMIFGMTTAAEEPHDLRDPLPSTQKEGDPPMVQ